MTTYYKYDDYGRFDGETTAATPRSTPIAPPRLSAEFNWNGQAWVYAPEVATVVLPVNVNQTVLSVVEALRKIDADTDKIYMDVVGNRESEYTRAETEAGQFKAANYAAPVPDSVAAWADAKGWDMKMAADDVVLQARKWRDMQQLIRRTRLKEKESVRQAQVNEIGQVLARWGKFVSDVRGQLGVET